MSKQKRPTAQEKEAIEGENRQTRPDPAFKEYTAEQARKAGLELRNVELPQLSITDLVLAVPDNLNLTETMFDFFGKVNLVEFKSEGDDFGLPELAFNQARAWLMLAKGEVPNINHLMSVFVTAHYPQKVLEFLQQEAAASYRAEREWLLRCRLGGIEVAVVVCRLLPIERKYYTWLMFAPVSSKKWQNFVTMLLEQDDLEMLKVVARLKPVEVGAMTIEANRKPRRKSAKQQAAFANMMRELYSEALIANKDYPEGYAELVQMGLQGLTPEQRLAGLKPEQIASRLTLEQRLAGLSPQERKQMLELLSQPDNQAGEGSE